MNAKVALVTGSARGIGKGIALALARNGFNLAINDMVEEGAAAGTLQELRSPGAGVLYCRADISKAADREAMLEKIKSHFGRLDLLVNNAGVAPKERKDLLDMDEESWDFVMNINLKGPFFLTQAAARWMVRQKQEHPDRSPTIINIASISSYTSSPARASYCVSKAGVSMMTLLFADRLSDAGVMVYEIRPGIIATDMTAPVREKYDRLIAGGLLPLKRWGTPEDIAAAAVALASGALPYSPGQVINVDGGFHIRRL